MLPWVDGGHTWINYGIYSVLNFLLESWRKEASRWCVFYFFSSLLNQLIKIPWYVLSLYIIYPSRHLDVVLASRARFEPTPCTKPSNKPSRYTRVCLFCLTFNCWSFLANQRPSIVPPSFFSSSLNPHHRPLR